VIECKWGQFFSAELFYKMKKRNEELAAVLD
jgi:hypothetical protein